MEKVSAIIIHEHGAAEKVARCERVELAPPGSGEVRVRMLVAPIHPADVNVLEGKYPVRPALPGVPGVEGVGVIEKTGQRVLLPYRFGSWREAGNAKEADLIAVPDGISDEQAAMLRINPATALLMLRDFVKLEPREWVVQNLSSSAVGRCVIRIARHFGWRTVNVVRRAEVAEELKAEGADAVIVEGGDISAATNGAPIRLALNAVGGDSAVRLASVLAPGGTIVTYGAMARQPLRIPNGLLIFQDTAWRGFWVTRWYERATAEERAVVFAELFELVKSGVVSTPVEAVYPLAEITTALEHAQRSERGGKVLLRGA